MKSDRTKLLFVKSVHTAVWVFYNLVLLYLFYAVIADKIDIWVWVCIGLFGIEGIVLLLFKNMCPLTIVARKFSNSQKANFDIFLPNWLAKNNKLIYSALLLLCILMLAYRLLQK